MVKFAPNFSYCAVDQEKAVFNGTDRFSHICLFGARNGQIGPEFLLLCCRPRKGRFSIKSAVSGPSALLGPEMVKFAPNFCYCAVDQEKTVFRSKQPELVREKP